MALLWLMCALSASHVRGQNPADVLKGQLPAPPANSPTQEVIPLAQSADPGDIVVEEQGAGLITLKVRNASLRQVVGMIAETQRVNIVFAAPQDMLISVSLIRVPWQQALETLLASTGYTMAMDQGIIVVTPVESAELLAPRAGGRRVETFELDFVKAVDVIQAVQGLLSPAGKAWESVSNTTDNRQFREVIAVVDFPGNLEQISQYIFQVDQPPRQVLIKANILEVKLSDDCQSGVNLQQLVSFSGNQIKLSTVGMANPSASTATFLELTGGSLDGLVELLQTTTDAKALASTELLTVSGQVARLQSGDQLGYRITTTTQTSSLESVEFMDVGVVLAVTPQVTRDGRVLMRVKPEVSKGQVDALLGIPAKETVEVETDVLLNSGQGLVIGGLIQEIDSNTQSKIPWLGDIPYAGILFQKRQIEKFRREIIVTLLPQVLPYTPIAQAHNDHRMMRAEQPLLCGPLNRYPRPYEAQLPDTFDNPTPICIHRYCHGATPALVEEPAAIESELGPTIETLGPPLQPANSGVPVASQPVGPAGPLVYPPSSTPWPAPVTRQATVGQPTYR